MSEDNHEPRSNGFTTKEMLVRLETIVDRIESKLDAKADKRDLDAYEIRVTAVEAALNLRLLALERLSNEVDAVQKYRRLLGGAVVTAATLTLGMIALLLTYH